MFPLATAAFTAGLASFLSPCVLPLVPGYVAVVSGSGLAELRDPDARRRHAVIANSVLFVLGFSLVFLALGAAASAMGSLVRSHIGPLTRAAGLLIVVLGLHQTGLVPIPLLYRTARFQRLPSAAAGTRSFLAGSAFGFGWTPCVGPVLTAVLTLAAAEATLARGTSLLALYALGLAIPFLLTAISIDGFLGFYRRFRRYVHALEVTGGAVTVAVGVLMLTHRIALLSSWLGDLALFRRLSERLL